MLVLGCVVLFLAVGCASASSKTFRDDGVSVRYPSNWHATHRALTPVTSPVQVLAVASYALPQGKAGADGCSPKEALDRLPPNGDLPLRLGVRPARAGRCPERATPAAA